MKRVLSIVIVCVLCNVSFAESTPSCWLPRVEVKKQVKQTCVDGKCTVQVEKKSVIVKRQRKLLFWR